MGRTGQPFAAQLYGVTPDLLTVAKGIAGGFPAAAVLASDEMCTGVGIGDLGSTFGGGPLAAAMIVATLDAIEQEDLRTAPPARHVLAALLERDILTGTSADPHVLRLLPPLVLQREHVDVLRAALAEVRT